MLKLRLMRQVRSFPSRDATKRLATAGNHVARAAVRAGFLDHGSIMGTGYLLKMTFQNQRNGAK